MNQFSRNSDGALHALSRRIGRQKKAVEEAQAEFDALWVEVFDTFDEFGKDGKDARFIADDGFFLYKQPYNANPKLNEELLERLIFQRYGPRKAKRIWNLITKPKVNSELLEEAVQAKLLDAGLVDECITGGNSSFSRIRKEWTKADHNRAKVLGIELKPEPEEKEEEVG